MTDGYTAGRAYAPVYRLSTDRVTLHEKLVAAVGQVRGRVLYASRPDRAPVYLGIETPSGERVGLLIYPFTANHVVTTNRPLDEHRLQVRYGGQKSWAERTHTIGRDLAGIDTTLVVGVHINVDLFIGLAPSLYDPLPMGISVEFKKSHVDAALTSEHGWHVFERNNIGGTRRGAPRARDGLETIVLFRPERLLDYVRLERTATDLDLDPSLRFAAAVSATVPSLPESNTVPTVHDLEAQFDMTSAEILEVINQRNRLAVAVRGGVAEHHLGKQLAHQPGVARVESLDEDGRHDFDVSMADGRLVEVECKNCSPQRYANGDMKVEVQKTRATQNDPAGRLYRPDQFDVVAACTYGPTGVWTFRYRRTSLLDRHQKFPDRLAPLHRVDDTWADTIQEAMAEPASPPT